VGAAAALALGVYRVRLTGRDVPITFADVSKASRMLGYAPKVPIREGLRRVAAWYCSRASADSR
jgi:UDP-glucuronate 4-epimerase